MESATYGFEEESFTIDGKEVAISGTLEIEYSIERGDRSVGESSRYIDWEVDSMDAYFIDPETGDELGDLETDDVADMLPRIIDRLRGDIQSYLERVHNGDY